MIWSLACLQTHHQPLSALAYGSSIVPSDPKMLQPEGFPLVLGCSSSRVLKGSLVLFISPLFKVRPSRGEFNHLPHHSPLYLSLYCLWGACFSAKYTSEALTHGLCSQLECDPMRSRTLSQEWRILVCLCLELYLACCVCVE